MPEMTGTNDFQFAIEPFTDRPADARYALDVLRKVFGNSYFSDEYWNWKYSRNPFGRSIMIAAWASNEGLRKIAGFRAFWRWRFRYHDKIVQAAQPCDTAVCPEYRRMGLFSLMTTKATELASEEAIEILFNNPNPESRDGYLKLGWDALDGLHWYAKPVTKMKVLSELLRWRNRNPVLKWSRPSHVWDGCLKGEELRPLLESCVAAHDEMLWTDRNDSFYRWRYGPLSHRAYNALFFEKYSGYQALLIYGTGERGNLREAQVLDFVTCRSYKDSAREMIQRLTELERPDWITFAATANFPFLGELRRAGFLPLPRTASLVMRGLSVPYLSPNPEALSLTLGDLDTF